MAGPDTFAPIPFLEQGIASSESRRRMFRLGTRWMCPFCSPNHPQVIVDAASLGANPKPGDKCPRCEAVMKGWC